MRKLLNWLPDSAYIALQFKHIMGYWPNLRNPKTFNEKLQYLKLHDRRQEYSVFADKLAVRDVVEKLVGHQCLVELYGAWEKPEDIDFASLPNQYVLKCNHDGGSTIICRDSKTFNINEATKKLNAHLKSNAYRYGREWPYKNIKPMVIAEKFMCPKISDRMIDYKFYCFNKKPQFLYISEGLEDHSSAVITFYDLQGKRMDFQRNDYPHDKSTRLMPDNFSEMISISEKIADYVNNDFCRVDLYSVDNKIYFSEITFTPCAGYMRFEPEEYDRIIGDMLNLT